jgi:YbgC/YbaW family acyl-CoA thioester hydrolase
MFSVQMTLGSEWMAEQYDHVHHGRSLSLLEHARIELLKSIGCPNDDLLSRGLVLVITRVDVRYKREVTAGEVTVTCDSGELSGRTIILQQRVVNSRGKVAIEAQVESMFMSAETRRGLDIPVVFAEAFRKWAQKV